MQSENTIKKSIGLKIKAARKNQGLTQYALAEKVNMDEKQLSRLEAGKHYPTLKTLLSLINVLNLKLADFDNCFELREPAFYELVEILRNSSSRELKKYLEIIKLIKSN